MRQDEMNGKFFRREGEISAAVSRLGCLDSVGQLVALEARARSLSSGSLL